MAVEAESSGLTRPGVWGTVLGSRFGVVGALWTWIFWGQRNPNVNRSSLPVDGHGFHGIAGVSLDPKASKSNFGLHPARPSDWS